LPFQEVPCRRIARTYWLRPHPPAVTIQACRKHAGIVEDEEVIGAEKAGEIAKEHVTSGSRIAIKMQKTRRAAIRERFLGNQLLRKAVIKFGYEHRKEL
jgi:hypothetical protein